MNDIIEFLWIGISALAGIIVGILMEREKNVA